MKLWFPVLLFLGVVNVHAEPGDVLIVTGWVVNMRAGPSMDNDILVQVKKGQRLVEIRRQGNWIEAETGLADTSSAWIYVSLVEVDREEEQEEVAEEAEDVVDEDNRQNDVAKTATEETTVAIAHEDARQDNAAKVESSFDLFRRDFAELNKRIKTRRGKTYFSNPQYKGKGVIEVTATEEWLGFSAKERNVDLSDIFEIWSTAMGDKGSITVFIVDRRGERRMYMFR